MCANECVIVGCHVTCRSEKSEMSSQFNIVNTNERDDSKDESYWTSFHHVITPDKDQVWDALLYTFNKYL